MGKNWRILAFIVVALAIVAGSMAVLPTGSSKVVVVPTPQQTQSITMTQNPTATAPTIFTPDANPTPPNCHSLVQEGANINAPDTTLVRGSFATHANDNCAS